MLLKIYIGAIMLLILLQVIHLSARIGRHRTKSMHKPKAEKRSICVGSKWKTVGSYRFWQRVACAQRRSNDTGPTTDVMDLLPSEEAGPARDMVYDPNYGHEPYWADGGWVFDKFVPNKTGSKYICGVRCALMFLEYGKICAQNKNNDRKTFESFCAMKSFDCHDRDRWTPLYRGECYRNLLPFFTKGGKALGVPALREQAT
ncbi:uncharacterized protein LOC118275613 isoform X2 [Spodoptera frugiperda]|uniref:Uncharacterized protein LOC118275613 isoform X2 n=1 Tax=Spodoptera frugiperda TaxID=7108 RepID=A0A9R0EQK9_SPOFR|nr:uncharacterized protein LOC118275613 isoform X2 [Spodoptera frugiperda]